MQSPHDALAGGAPFVSPVPLSDSADDRFWSVAFGRDGKVYAASENCHVSVLKAGAEWEPLARNDFQDLCYATPAPVDDRLYLRTSSALYCFGVKP